MVRLSAKQATRRSLDDILATLHNESSDDSDIMSIDADELLTVKIKLNYPQP